MNTKTLAHPGFRKIILTVAGAALVASSFFAAVPRARAASLTEVQIQSILNLLIAFNVPAATIANVNVILHKSK